MLMVLVMTPYLRIRRKSKELKEIFENRVFGRGKFAEIRHRGFDQVLSGGLPCSRSGWYERKPSMIHDSAFFYASHF